jgi:hypothetical protein
MRLFRYILLALVAVSCLLPALAVPAQAASAPAISLSPASGPAGTIVTVTGTGFPKKSVGTVSNGAATTAFTATATGYFTARLIMPDAGTPRVPVQAVAARSSAAASFTLTPAAGGQQAAPLPPGPSAARLRFGTGTPGGPAATAELDDVAFLAGEAPSVVLSYKDFNQPPPLAELDSVRARGAVTLLAWEPWTWGAGTSQPAYALDRITAGDFDPYLRQWGQALAAWGHPVMLRFGHEMNGDWYPWSEQVNSNGPGDYVAAWRHVHDTVVSAGATNVAWVWNPNVPYTGATELSGLYPGASYVDAVALDGYNWGTSASWGTWISPADLFGGGLSQLRTLAPGKEILIAETSSAEQGGSKPAWNTSLISYLAAQADITAVVWFNFNKETDWRINSSPASADALRSALAARRP